MLDKIKVGIIGITPHQKGRIDYLNTYLKGLEILAASGSTQRDLLFAKNDIGLQYVYSDHSQLVNNNDIDAVFVWSPSTDHAIHAISAIDANKHVMLDLPFGTNVNDTQRIIEAAKSRPSQTTFCPLKGRYNPMFVAANDLIDKGVIGIPVMAQLYHGRKVEISEDEKMSLNRRSIFIDLALTEIDLVRWMFGKDFKEVSAIGRIAQDQSLKMTNDVDTAQVQATVGDNQYVQFSLSRFPINSEDSRLFVQGTKASLLMDNQGLKVVHKEGVDHHVVSNHDLIPEFAETQIVQDFCDQINQRKKARNSLEDAAKTTEVAVAMAKSLIMESPIVL